MLREVHESTRHIPWRVGLCMMLFVVTTRADLSSDRLLVLGQDIPVGAEEGIRGGRGSLQGAQIHFQRSGGSRQI
ncbi:hypothetical protein PF008_g21868 [Phytophthora fragariae]|uniref:Uncharacterized protein n=1 Tax=Phytophthora fragariae TaxID=53985 RepID=A0A6G0QWF8_9STRA|nr:hypothetical protein PF008_g21868 [Phytophthora fragariae]